MNDTTLEKPEKKGIRAWLKKKIVPLSGLSIALIIIVAAGYVYLKCPEILNSLKAYGYLGAFFISVFLNATIIIPVSNMAIVFSLGGNQSLLPYLVGLASGAGAVIGEMTGYIAGRSGRGLLARSKVYNRVEGWVKKWGWLAVFIMSIVPFVFDVVGIIAGALRMPLWRFFIACWLGRTIAYVTVAYLGKWGFDKAIQYFS